MITMPTSKRIHPGDGDPRHGTLNGYTNLHCRCADCCRQNTIRCGVRRAQRHVQGLPEGDPRHGTPNGYGNFGCRCRSCTTAWTEDGKKRPSYQAKHRVRSSP